jgi:hypothetical protein
VNFSGPGARVPFCWGGSNGGCSTKRAGSSKNHDLDKITFASVIGAANRVQMCRWQVVV